MIGAIVCCWAAPHEHADLRVVEQDYLIVHPHPSTLLRRTTRALPSIRERERMPKYTLVVTIYVQEGVVKALNGKVVIEKDDENNNTRPDQTNEQRGKMRQGFL
jgi:hypothetical protein